MRKLRELNFLLDFHYFVDFYVRHEYEYFIPKKTVSVSNTKHYLKMLTLVTFGLMVKLHRGRGCGRATVWDESQNVLKIHASVSPTLTLRRPTLGHCLFSLFSH